MSETNGLQTAIAGRHTPAGRRGRCTSSGDDLTMSAELRPKRFAACTRRTWMRSAELFGICQADGRAATVSGEIRHRVPDEPHSRMPSTPVIVTSG